MCKNCKIIPAFFLWFAALAVCTHLMIPHDHHLADSTVSQQESCPASNNHTGHNTGFPVHCHAFNDLASEKATIFVLNKSLLSSDLSPKCYTDALILDINSSCLNYSDFREPVPDHYLLEFSPFRAPPQVS